MILSSVIAFIGFQEVTVILVISILVFGPKKIPEIARGLGEGIRAMRQATDEIKREVMESAKKADPTGEVVQTQKEIQSEIDNAKKEMEEVVGSIKRK